MTTRRTTPLAALLALLLGASSLVAAAPSHAGSPADGTQGDVATDAAPIPDDGESDGLVPQNDDRRPDDAGQPSDADDASADGAGTGGENADGSSGETGDGGSDPQAEDEVDPYAHLEAWEGMVEVVPGNDSAASCPDGTTFVKHDSDRSGTVDVPEIDGVSGAVITVTVHADGQYWDFTLEQGDGGDLAVYAAISKGSDSYAIYTFDGGVDVGTALVSPLNNGGNISALSHASFCLDVVEDGDSSNDEPVNEEEPGNEGPVDDDEDAGSDEDEPATDDDDMVVDDDESSQDDDEQGSDETVIRVDPQPLVLGIVLEPEASIASACVADTDQLSVVVDLDNRGSTSAATYTVETGDDAQNVTVAAGSTDEVRVVLTPADGEVTISVLAADETLVSDTFDADGCVAEVRGIVEVRDDVAGEGDADGEPEAEVRGVAVERAAATLPQTGVSAVLMAIMGLVGMGIGGGLLVSRREA